MSVSWGEKQSSLCGCLFCNIGDDVKVCQWHVKQERSSIFLNKLKQLTSWQQESTTSQKHSIMDRQLTFEILLYLNMFFTSFYACIEAFFLLMKYLYVPDFGKFKTFTCIYCYLSTYFDV